MGEPPARPSHSAEGGLFVRSWPGSDEAPPILFIHGLGESGLGFERLAALPGLGRWPRWVPDLPGYGRSPWPARPLALAEHADRLAEWLAERSAPPCAVVGHSMGGVIALLLAERHPDRVATLIDVEGNKSLDDCAFSSQTVDRSVGEFENDGFEAICEKVLAAAADDPTLATYYASLRYADPRSFHANGRELVELSRGEELAARLARLAAPTLYVGGVGRPGGVGERSLELLRRAEVETVTLSPAGHWVFLDRPRAFLSLLVETLTARGGV